MQQGAPAWQLRAAPRRRRLPVLLDPLTGLCNHRGFQERLRTEIAAARARRSPVSLAIVDVDGFHALNETSGHHAGDAVLAAVAARLRAVARPGDIPARIGADEFALILPGAGAGESVALLDRARTEIRVASLDAGLRVTFSAGVVSAPEIGDSAGAVRLAEAALAWSRIHGGDRTAVYDCAVMQHLTGRFPGTGAEHAHALAAIRALARAIDAKDPSTRRHSERVAALAGRIGTALGWRPERVMLLEEAALIHDVGKIGVPDAVLLKPGSLGPAEYEQVKRHAQLGAEIAADVLTPEQVRWIRGHHERPDGRGYPDALTGDEISDGAAVLAVADAFDVMTMPRPYSRPKTAAEALRECRALVGGQFSPEPVEALLSLGALAA